MLMTTIENKIFTSRLACWEVTVDQGSVVTENNHESFDLLLSRVDFGHYDILEEDSFTEGWRVEVFDPVAPDDGENFGVRPVCCSQHFVIPQIYSFSSIAWFAIANDNDTIFICCDRWLWVLRAVYVSERITQFRSRVGEVEVSKALGCFCWGTSGYIEPRNVTPKAVDYYCLTGYEK